MRAGAHAITVEAQIILSRRELAVLNHICSFDHTEYFKGLVSSHYEGGVNRDEMVSLMKDIQAATSALMVRIQSSKEHLFGSASATTPACLESASKLTH